MVPKRTFKYLFVVTVIVMAGVALADSLGYFNHKPYKIIRHGAISHYVPYNRDPDVEISRFPTHPPGPDEMITPTGQIVKKSTLKQERNGSRPQNVNKITAKNIRTINIAGIDQLRFAVMKKSKRLKTGNEIETYDGSKYWILKSIEAKPGEKLRIRFTAHSRTKSRMMSHDWVLLRKNVNPQNFAKSATYSNNYVPDPGHTVIANTKLVSSGDTTTVAFTVPHKTGKYLFICSYMGHFFGGMKGWLIVQ